MRQATHAQEVELMASSLHRLGGAARGQTYDLRDSPAQTQVEVFLVA